MRSKLTYSAKGASLIVLLLFIFGVSAKTSGNTETLQKSSNGSAYSDQPAMVPIGKLLYDYDELKWLFIGCENDHPKSWTFMGGGLRVGQLDQAIQYTVTIGNKTYFPDEFAPDRKTKIKWYLRDGYQPCPVSEWQAGPVTVEIQHFADRILDDRLTAVFSRVRIINNSAAVQKVRLNINASPTIEIPLTGAPTASGINSMSYDITINIGQSAQKDFMSIASGDIETELKLNKVKNPGFEEDILPTKSPAKWTVAGDADAVFTTGWNAPGYDWPNLGTIWQQQSGKYMMAVSKPLDHNVYIYQTINDLPDGNYELRAWVRTSGEHKNCTMIAKNYGGSELSADITGQVYHPIIINSIKVTNGKCEIGFISEGNAKSYLFVDDVALYPATDYCMKVLRDLKADFDTYYKEKAAANNATLNALAHPVILPIAGLTDMYKAILFSIPQLIVQSGTDYEMRSGTRVPNPPHLYSYDRTFTHDVPNFADQFMREGDFERGTKIITSAYYKTYCDTILENGICHYLDTQGKYMLPYAEYLRSTGDLAFFTPEIKDELKTTARNLHKLRVYSDPKVYGLISKGSDFENFSGDYLLSDNWAALHGLQAYKYMCEKFGDTEEVKWVTNEIIDWNNCLNKALDKTCERDKTDYYMGFFDPMIESVYPTSFYSWVPYGGALAGFPWGAYLIGYNLGGTWKDKFDASIEYSLKLRDLNGIPEGSWGAWWGMITYGSTYNASAGIQCLFSEKYRTEAIKNIEFLYNNQCAPFQWSEAFENKGRDQWVGMYTPRGTGGYGNYETWGYSFTKQALLQACVSVKTDGTVIIGRGIPNHWLKAGDVTEWAGVNVNDNRKINFKIIGGDSEITLKIWGDKPNGMVCFNLPVFKNNIVSASAGKVDNEMGSVSLEPSMTSVTVKLKN
jgi:hypothetical protein